MGAWSDLVLSVSTLAGLAGTDWSLAVQGDVDTDAVAQAKATVQALIEGEPGVATYVAQAGSTEAFLDLAVAQSALSASLQGMLGRAYLHHDYFDRAPTPESTLFVKALREYNPEGAGGRGTGLLVKAVRGFCSLAPVVLGQSQRPAGSGASAAFASTMDRYNRT